MERIPLNLLFLWFVGLGINCEKRRQRDLRKIR